MEEFNEHPFGIPRKPRLPKMTGRTQIIRSLEIGHFVEVEVRADNNCQKQRELNNIRSMCSVIKRDCAEFFVRAGTTAETVFILRTK